jgi:hypothetical protein
VLARALARGPGAGLPGGVLAPYSPELNPIERVWKLVRRLCLHNRYFPDLALVSAAADERFAQWAHGSPVLVKLCAVA